MFHLIYAVGIFGSRVTDPEVIGEVFLDCQIHVLIDSGGENDAGLVRII